MDRQTMGIVRERGEQQLERGLLLMSTSEVPRKGQPGPPVLWILCDGLFAVLRKSSMEAEREVAALQTFEDEGGAVRQRLGQLFPRFHGAADVALLLSEISKVQVCRSRALVCFDGVGV
jgi:hypothetical protein